MSARNSSFFVKPCDDNFCFFIKDFVPGDCLIVRQGRRGRIRSLVESVDNKKMIVFYKNADGDLQEARLNDVIYLGPPKKGWLDR